MPCPICGNPLDLPHPYGRITVCQSCYAHLEPLKTPSSDVNEVTQSTSYFQQIAKCSKGKTVIVHGVSVPLTKEYVDGHRDYYEAFTAPAVKTETTNAPADNKPSYVLTAAFEDDMKAIREMMGNIERYTGFFYVLGVIGLVLTVLGLIFLMRQ